MDYRILAKQYFSEADTLKSYIKNLKKFENKNPEDLNLKYRIKMLYEMYLELKNTGEYLMHKSEVTTNEQR